MPAKKETKPELNCDTCGVHPRLDSIENRLYKDNGDDSIQTKLRLLREGQKRIEESFHAIWEKIDLLIAEETKKAPSVVNQAMQIVKDNAKVIIIATACTISAISFSAPSILERCLDIAEHKIEPCEDTHNTGG